MNEYTMEEMHYPYGQDMGSEYINLFSVPIQIIRLELNIDSLIEFCYEMKLKNEKGVEISNVGGWQSGDILNETHTEFVKLKNEIGVAANIYHDHMQLKKKYSQNISNIWANINQKGHSNGMHFHSGSLFSGVFYLKGNAPIGFQHPEKILQSWNDSFVETFTSTTSSEYTVNPEPNVLLIFPAWLCHKVHMNREDGARISLGFNTTLYEI